MTNLRGWNKKEDKARLSEFLISSGDIAYERLRNVNRAAT